MSRTVELDSEAEDFVNRHILVPSETMSWLAVIFTLFAFSAAIIGFIFFVIFVGGMFL